MGSAATEEVVGHEVPQENGEAPPSRRFSEASRGSQTAQEFIASQLQLEADAREVFPYQFSSCTKPLGALRQILFSCLTCNPPPGDTTAPYNPAGVCYSCSIACHGDHELVELFNKRNFVCDCGTTRLPVGAPCTLRVNQETGTKGDVHSETPAASNVYNQNYRNHFCGCGKVYDPHNEKGVMFQCLGLGTIEDGGCGEDWWHAECIMGLDRDPQPRSGGTAESAQNLNATPGETQVTAGEAEEGDEESSLPPGFPDEHAFEHFICYKCTEAFSWTKQYAGTPGFLAGVRNKPNDVAKTESPTTERTRPLVDEPLLEVEDSFSRKRKASEDEEDTSTDAPSPKKTKAEGATSLATSPEHSTPSQKPRHAVLPPGVPYPISLFLCEDFRDHFCRCPSCFPLLKPHPHLLEEEESYEPPVSESDEGEGGSLGSRSLLDRGEAALSNMDRVRAIEGVMAYNHLKDKVKSFLAPFAESGRPVGAEDVKAYFEKLRGDDEAILAAGARSNGRGDNGGSGSNREEQSGY